MKYTGAIPALTLILSFLLVWLLGCEPAERNPRPVRTDSLTVTFGEGELKSTLEIP